MCVRLIVGLGNPGPQYAGTRHNIGFDVVDELASRWGVSLAGERFHGWFGLGSARGDRVALLKPTTYMNRSGQAVLAAGRFYKLELSDLLIVVDDLALPVGRIRVRGSGSAGSHNGLQDIIDRLGNDGFARLRVGIGAAVGVPSNYVLGRFDETEKPIVERTARRAADCVECWVKEGMEAAMNRFNGDTPPDSAAKP